MVGGLEPPEGEGMGVRRVLRRTAVMVGGAGVLMTGSMGAANAYNESMAAAYADQYSQISNPAWYAFSDDCTNFVSQALQRGGAIPQGTPNGLVYNNDTQWWAYAPGAQRTYSWSVARDLLTFEASYNPNANSFSVQGPYANNQWSPYTPSAIKTGDPIFYYWGSDGHWDHAGIQVGLGTDPTSGWYGNLQDQHTNYRYHAIWNLVPYNSQWPTTQYAEVHIHA